MKKRITWHDKKAARNRIKHDEVTFEEAATVFGDPLASTIDDPAHSQDECRYITIGESSAARLLTVSYTETDAEIRIISARKPSVSEREEYEEGL
jgi:uncharacterized DUF497 family protein